MDEDIARKIHYPACWDVAAYPTLASALWELLAWTPYHNGCEEPCPECGGKFGVKE